IQLLIKNKIEESVTLEYKRELDNDNKEIAKDKSALANTEGGNIIYGVRTQDRIPTEINWLLGNGTEERIQKIIMSTIQPTLKEVEVIRVANPSEDAEAIFIANVPKSPHAPHMVLNRYYTRRGSVSSPMEDADVKSAILGVGRLTALRFEISKNSDLADRTRKLIEQIYVYPPEQRHPIALIPLHTDAWNAIVASGLLYSLEGTVAEHLVEAYGHIHEMNSLIAWLNMNNPTVAHTPVDPTSAKHGIYLPALLRDKLPRLSTLLKEIVTQLS
ncbi:helix-turn-helix domain-containing protein, partial [Chloroflexota bacterium]